MTTKGRGSKSKGGGLNSTSAMLGVGLELGLLIGGLTFLGHLADNRWDIEPYGVLTGAVAGMIGGCFSAYRVVNPPKQKKRTTGRAKAEDKTPKP